MKSGYRAARTRRGFSIKDAVVVLVIIGVLLAVGFPTFVYIREQARSMQCEGNLRKIGQALDRYKAADPSGTYPIGSGYDLATKSSGVSWWAEIMPHAEGPSPSKWIETPNRGDFSRPTPNENIKWVDGYQPSIMFCPASSLPMFNDPLRHISEANRQLLGDKKPVGIPVPMYSAVAGGAPDLRDNNLTKSTDAPAGRNTQDGRWGILSDSGLFPPNKRVQHAAIVDQKDKTIMVVEQSGYVQDHTVSLEPPDLYDVRSAWPRGAFMGTAGDYKDLKPTQTGINGDGGERCWNLTTVRYGINYFITGKKGIVTDPPLPRPAKEGEEPPPPPPYPPEGYGPGHNHPITSPHPGGATVLMAGGGTKFLNQNIDLIILLRMATRDDKIDVAD